MSNTSTSPLGDDIPQYGNLPLAEPGARHSWNVFGPDDNLGRLNLLGPPETLSAISEIKYGKIYNLSLPLDLPDPPWGGPMRKPYKHHVYDIDENTKDDYLDSFYLQRSTQWDGLRHVSAGPLGFYGGVDAQSLATDSSLLGIQHWAQHGIVGRGVLLDIAHYLEKRGEPLAPSAARAITVDDLQEASANQNTKLNTGDILMLRTGYMAAYLSATADGRRNFAARLAGPGLDNGEQMAEYLWNSGASAVVTDNPAVEVVPDSHQVGSLHRRLIPLLGFALGEFFNFEQLASECRQDNYFACMFVAAPLNLPGGIGSPGNAIAIR